LKKGQAGLIAVYATNMADQNDRVHKPLVDAVASGRITAEPDKVSSRPASSVRSRRR
jgi:hypothetical protein